MTQSLPTTNLKGWEMSVNPSDVPAIQIGDSIPLKITA